MSAPLTITLDNSTTGNPRIFQYSNNSFFPIDGQLFGDQRLVHNYHFTYEIHSAFDFVGDEFFTFSGDDDLWVFINGVLAVDVGGVHVARTGTVDLADPNARAALGITPGNTYDFDLFFAERKTSQSNFTITTSLALVPEPGAAVLLGVGALALLRWRRAAR